MFTIFLYMNLSGYPVNCLNMLYANCFFFQVLVICVCGGVYIKCSAHQDRNCLMDPRSHLPKAVSDTLFVQKVETKNGRFHQKFPPPHIPFSVFPSLFWFGLVFLSLIVCVSLFFLHICLCLMCKSGAHRSQRRTSDPCNCKYRCL